MSGRSFAGALAERVVIERWQRASDDLAGDPGHWTAEATGWANIVPIGRGSAEDGAALSARRRYRIEMRDDPATGLEHRLIWEGRVMTLLSIERDPRQRDRMALIAEVRE